MRFALAIITLLAVPAMAQQVQTNVDPNTKSTGGLGFSKHDSSQPINVTADRFDANLETKVGTYHGNVVVIQGDMRMRADAVQIVEVQDKPNKVYAHGNVVVDAPNGTGTGDEGVDDLIAKTITLTGKKVVLTKEKNVMVGTKLIMDQNTNLAHLTAEGLPGQRVKGVFQPKQDSNAGSGNKKPAPNGGK